MVGSNIKPTPTADEVGALTLTPTLLKSRVGGQRRAGDP